MELCHIYVNIATSHSPYTQSPNAIFISSPNPSLAALNNSPIWPHFLNNTTLTASGTTNSLPSSPCILSNALSTSRKYGSINLTQITASALLSSRSSKGRSAPATNLRQWYWERVWVRTATCVRWQTPVWERV